MVKVKNKVLVFTTPKRVKLFLFYWFPCPISSTLSGLSMPFILLIYPQFRFAGLPQLWLFKSSTTTVVIQLDNLLTPNQDPFRSQIFPVFRFGTPKIKKIILYIIVYQLVMKITRRDRGSQEKWQYQHESKGRRQENLQYSDQVWCKDRIFCRHAGVVYYLNMK